VTDTISVAEAVAEIKRLSGEIAKANTDGRTFALQQAKAENVYRKEVADCWAEARLKGEIKTTTEMKPWVEGKTADKRQDRDVAQIMASSMLELERDLRQQLSAFQTTVNFAKSDMEFHRNGQTEGQ
jgi:hypothetical protein